MTLLRSLYNRHLRDTFAGELARSLKRSAARMSEQLRWRIRDLPHRMRLTKERVGTALSRRRQRAASHGVDTSTTLKNIWYRARYIARCYRARMAPAWPWLFASRETSNFTYDLTERNRAHLAAMIAMVFRLPVAQVVGYIEELLSDEDLKWSVIDRVNAIGRGAGLDATAAFGRRIGWYAIARAMKPKVIIETGVEKGLGSVVLCAALLRNSEEGHHGRYYGTDIDLAAGMLLAEPYRSMGEILYGDSLGSLAELDLKIDLFINDSDHSAEYEAREYAMVEPKLSEKAVLLADNAHVTDELYHFAERTGRQFLFFREEPANHWYLGAGIGLAFR